MTARSDDPGAQLRDIDRQVSQLVATSQGFRGTIARMQRVVMSGDETVSLLGEFQRAFEMLQQISMTTNGLMVALNDFRQNPSITDAAARDAARRQSPPT